MAYLPQPEIQNTRNLEQYYAESNGGNNSFGSCSGAVDVSSKGGIFAIFVNPIGSGVNAHVARSTVGQNQEGRIERFTNATVTVIKTATPQPLINRGGGTTVSPARLYVPPNATATGGAITKVSFLKENTTFPTEENGSVIVRPGQNLIWSYVPDSNKGTLLKGVFLATLEITWWNSQSN